MAASTARARRGEVVRGVFQVLLDKPHGLQAREVIARVREIVPPTEFDLTEYENRPGVVRYDKQVRFNTIAAVKAGWLVKKDGIWRLTDSGREAYHAYQDPEEFERAAARGYAAWKATQGSDAAAADPLAETIEQAIASVQSDMWTSFSDLAEFAGTTWNAVWGCLSRNPISGAHHVLRGDGSIPENLPWPSELGIVDQRAMLEADGVEFDDQGHADPALQATADILRSPSDTDVRRVWLVRGSNVQGVNLVRDLWLPHSVCSLPATRLRTLPIGSSRAVVKAAIDDDYAHASVRERARMTNEYHAFLSRMSVDDIILTNIDAVFYIGVVTGEPAFVTSVNNRANLQCPVEWRNVETPIDYSELPDAVSARLGNSGSDLVELTEFVGDFERLLGVPITEPESAREFHLPDVTEDFAARMLYDYSWLQECVELLWDRPQMIFYGPPGTGKTFLAQEFALHLTGGKRENIGLVQFHPAYSYEDFFEGLRPVTIGDGKVVFDVVDGPLRDLATAAAKRPDEPHVLIIDEINRGNVAKIFGELYFLLEYRNRAVKTMYRRAGDDTTFALPANLVIIGTMNTADRSIALVDTALRRRFWFRELHPGEPPVRGLLEAWLTREGLPTDAAHLLDELNNRIEDRQFSIGPSYLMTETACRPGGLDRVWRTQILPLLEEHHYGEWDRNEIAARYGLDALRAHLGLAKPDDAS